MAKRRSRKVKGWQRKFAKAARFCGKKKNRHGKSFKTCMRKKLKALAR